jgi:hypothetical protein
MSFFADNKNFIYIKLGHEMKGLTRESKSEKFKALKGEVNTRLKKSYENLHSVEDKLNFYEEAFSCLGEYQSDYLMLNLFFEKEFSRIYSGIKFPPYINEGKSFGSNLSVLLSQASTESEIIVNMMEKISGEFDLSHNDWHNHESHNNPIVNKWAIKMANHCENYEQFLSKTLWFEKSWQMTFENRTPALKATIFLAKLMVELDSNNDVKMTFARNYLKYAKERADLFIEKIKLPIFYSSVDQEVLNFKGVSVQKNKFDDIISEHLSIEEFERHDYAHIFENFDSENQIIRSRAQSLIDKKLNRGELPSKSDNVLISSSTGSIELKSLRNHLLRRAYLFEFNDF